MANARDDYSFGKNGVRIGGSEIVNVVDWS